MTQRTGTFRPTIITVGVLLAVGLVLGAVVPKVLERQRTDELRSTTKLAYAAAAPTFDRTREADAAVLTAVLGPARLQSRSVRCVMDDDQAGLMVQNYRQVCTLRSVDAYPTTLGFDQLSTRLDTKPPKGQHRDGCGVLRRVSDGRGSLEVVVSRLEAGQFFGADDPSGLNEFCAAPTPEFDWGVVRAEPTFVASDISPDHSWVTVVHDQEFLRKDLGCRGILFCNSPVSGPVLP